MIGKVLLQADLDYSYSPWKYHGDEVMVETTLDVRLSRYHYKHFILEKADSFIKRVKVSYSRRNSAPHYILGTADERRS